MVANTTEDQQLESTLRPLPLRRRLLFLAIANGVALLVLGAFAEVVFRSQIVDTYRAELLRYNAHADLERSADVLFFGDSFTAGRGQYPAVLAGRPGFAGRNLVNAAVSGTTARDAARLAPGRMSRFEPSVAVYQIYVGNDLLETQLPVHSARSVARRAYWWLLNRGWTSLGWLNYRLRGFSPESLKARVQGPPVKRGFEPSTYQGRERRWISTLPSYLTYQRDAATEAVWRLYQADLTSVFDALERGGRPVILLVIPHCTEVSPRYRERFVQLGLRESAQPQLGGGGEWRRRLDAFAAARGDAIVVDALDALTAAEEAGVGVYLDDDPHLNRQGQTVIASLLEPVLRDALGHAEAAR